MTLFRQLILAVLVLFVLVYGGNTYVNIANNRTLVEQQMQVHAQDTATSLALSMTQAAQQNDTATLETLFNAISDSGFFQHIYFRNLKGDIEMERRFPVSVEGAPDWFIRWTALPDYQGKAEVNAGWTRLGELVVVSHPGQAYLRLWEITRVQLIWFALMVFVACLMSYAALRWILTPLARVEGQANAISESDFQVIEDIPRTRELANVVQAMNHMSLKLKTLFAEQMGLIASLRKQSSIDEMTGLPNRADFDAQMLAYVGDESGKHAGLLGIISADGVAEINVLAGRKEGNAFLKAFGRRISDQLAQYPHALVSKRQGVQFTFFVPDIDKMEATALAKEVFESVQSLTWGQSGDMTPSFNMGFVFEAEITDVSELMSCADMALTKSIQIAPNTCQDFASIDSAEAPVLSSSAEDLQELLLRFISSGDIQLHYQPVISAVDKRLLSQEVYVRFPDNDRLLSAATLIPVAEKLGLITELDKLILHKAAEAYAQKALNAPLRVNLSAHTLQAEGFGEWLDNFLLSNKHFAPNLIVEMKEQAVRSDKQAVEMLNSILVKHQTKLCIDHFGLESSAFAYLGTLKIHCLKVHRSFAVDLANHTDNQFYIKALTSLAHNLDIELYVEGVESQSVWDQLQNLKVDGAQGYFLGEPSAEPVVQA